MLLFYQSYGIEYNQKRKENMFAHIRGTQRMFAIAVILGLIFQVGHFAEHVTQFYMWLVRDRTAPYMSPVANSLSCFLGNAFVRGEAMCGRTQIPTNRQMMVGMEILHLIGNGIFLATIAGLYRFYRHRFVRYALYVEGFHLCEHLMLTASVVCLGYPVGFSTLFGTAGTVMAHNAMVGYRVGWHFIMNLIPSGLIMAMLMRTKERRTPIFATA